MSAPLAPHPVSLLPFAALLGAIALLPLLLEHHWERNYAKICALLSAVTAAYYIFGLREGGRVLHAAAEYGSFVVVVGTFFVVAGGIHLHIPRPTRPWMNAGLLLGGSLLANLIGTIAASMLLIRPWLHVNRERVRPFHLAFFVFTVSNLGGALLPLGPPLFLGYLKGVPFFWALRHCWPEWTVAMGVLLLIFLVVDSIRARGCRAEAVPIEARVRCYGTWNFGLLLLLLAAVILLPAGWREFVMVGLAALSFWLTPRRVHEANEFQWRPLIEVGWIFLGIFGTMIPVIDYVEVHASELHLLNNSQFYWGTGLLSGVLDNAPTYLTSLAAALSLAHLDLNRSQEVARFAAAYPERLAAISAAATFFGGLTYIGNSPNLLVRAIAQSRGAPTPGFLAYITLYALPILLPVLLLIGWLFFRS